MYPFRCRLLVSVGVAASQVIIGVVSSVTGEHDAVGVGIYDDVGVPARLEVGSDSGAEAVPCDSDGH